MLPRLVVALACMSASGCAGPLASACGQVLGEVAIELAANCLTSICEDELGGDDVSDDDDQWHDLSDDEARAEGARRIAEAPPPDWAPAPGLIPCVVRDDEERGRTFASCADGTYAVFDTARLRAVTDVLTREEPTRTNDACAGTVRLRGVDDDGDGALATSELTGRTVTCAEDSEVFAPTLTGDLAVHDPSDIALLAGRRALTGGLQIVSDTLLELFVPTLRSLGGSLRITEAPALERAGWQRLARVNRDVKVSDTRLTRLELLELTDVGGAVEVTDNVALPQREVERFVRQLTRRGFSGPVLSGGNAR